MHLIPATSSHLHILVSVFPSVGLIFALGFYVASLVTKNDYMQRSCLLAFVVLALLGIPTYLSGIDSATVISQNPKISQEQLIVHYGWSLAALALLGLLGIASVINLWRFRGRLLSNNALHLVLGLAIVTLAFMALVGEMGWEINHREFLLATKPFEGTPQLWSHFHVILNHFPTVGSVFGLAFFILGLTKNNVTMIRGALVIFVICGILGAPTYVTGASAMWALTDPPYPGISKAAINAHRDWAAFSLIGLAFTGVTAWIELWRFRYHNRFSRRVLYTILGFAIVTLGLMAETGHRGGQINHPEIRVDPLPTDPNAYFSPHVESLINNVIWFVPWQTVHFFGYTLVFATVVAVTLRVLGFWKSMPFSAVYRLLPLGVAGVTMNVFSGMLMLMADTFRYVNEVTFIPKMFFLPIGAIAVLYFSLSDRLWNVKAGEDAPMLAKWVAVLVLISWTIVITGGRLLPYV